MSHIPSSPLLPCHLSCNYPVLSETFARSCLLSSQHPASTGDKPPDAATGGQHYISGYFSLSPTGINFITLQHNGSTTYHFGSRLSQKPSLFYSKARWYHLIPHCAVHFSLRSLEYPCVQGSEGTLLSFLMGIHWGNISLFCQGAVCFHGAFPVSQAYGIFCCL